MCYFPCIIVYFVVVFLSILQSDEIDIAGQKNDITGQKTISRDISFLCHRVIALIKAQVCDKASYHISNLDLLHTEFEGEHPINTADPLVNNAQTALQDNPINVSFAELISYRISFSFLRSSLFLILERSKTRN